MGEQGSADSEHAEYQRVFAILDELNLSSLKPLFKEKHIRDKTLSFMKTDEELKLVLKEELGLPFGQRFEFCRLWFEKYHGTEANDGEKVSISSDKKDQGISTDEKGATSAVPIQVAENDLEEAATSLDVNNETPQKERDTDNILGKEDNNSSNQQSISQSKSKKKKKKRARKKTGSDETMTKCEAEVNEGTSPSAANDNRHASQVTSTGVEDGRTSTRENETTSGRSKEPFNEQSEILQEQSNLTEEVITSSNQKSSPENRSKKKKKKKASKETGVAGTIAESEGGKQEGQASVSPDHRATAADEDTPAVFNVCEDVLRSKEQEETFATMERYVKEPSAEHHSSILDTTEVTSAKESETWLGVGVQDMEPSDINACRGPETISTKKSDACLGASSPDVVTSDRNIGIGSETISTKESEACLGASSPDVVTSDRNIGIGSETISTKESEACLGASTPDVVTSDRNIGIGSETISTKESNVCLEASAQDMSDRNTYRGPLLANAASNNSKMDQDLEGKHPRDGGLDPQKDSEGLVRCNPRPRGVAGRDYFYEKGSVLDTEESRELEFKSLGSAQRSSLPWKIMEKAKKFICACLNADIKGIIYFGVGDSQEKGSKYQHREILGLNVEKIKDDINKAFQFVLDDHIKSDAGPLQKGGEQNCVNIHFVPVKSQGNRSNLYVVEIEVARDWRFCKDNIYYSKSWSEKRGDKDCAGKKGLGDFFKVKDEYEDAAIRTNWASSCVKQHDVYRQVKHPLEEKYKEWKKTQREVTLDDADAKRIRVVLRERLRELNYKEYGYILIANKMSARYRGTARLSFLQNIPWIAVFDLFDASSKQDGLYYACNETTDAPRAKIRTLDDFNDLSPDKDSFISTRGTTWILSNEEMQKGGWVKCSKDCMHRTLFAYKQCFAPGKLVCVFLGLSESAVEEMADVMESCFSILGNSAGSCATIVSETKSVAEAFIKASRPSLRKELRDCSLPGTPWVLFEEIVYEMVGPSKFDEKGATTELPFYSGIFKPVLNKVINSWEDLEVYSPNPHLPSLADAIEKERNAFYKGAQASQLNLFHDHSIPRTLENEVINKVDRALKSLRTTENSVLYPEISGTNCCVITVPYEPGSGATTLCRRILWKRRNECRCAVVKAITPSTDYYIDKLQSIAYDEKNSSLSFPVLVLVDSFPESDARHLIERIMMRQTKCVVLSTFSIAKSAMNSTFNITPLRKLDEKETSLVKDILINITRDAVRRREVEEVLEREKRFIWFGLELFGRDYLKIEERLKNHINSILTDSLGIQQTLLNMCCFLYKYSEGYSILPHAVIQDFLYYSNARTKEELSDVHEIFGGLLLAEHHETCGYYGWRPAHSLVSEVVTSRISLEDTAVYFLKEVCKWNTHAVKVLRKQAFKVLLERKKIADPVFLEEQEGEDTSDGSNLDDDVFGFSEVRTRYSPVIEDILVKENNTPGALRVLITICEEATQKERKSHAWQQLARFVGYQMRSSEMNENDDLHKQLHKAMISEKKPVPLPMPGTGIEAAHIAVDIAITLQPNYFVNYGTKGALYNLQLTKPEERRPNLLPSMIEMCRKASEMYDKALKVSQGHDHYSMIGKIKANVLLLKFVKSLPCFGREDESFTRFLQTGEFPLEMASVLSTEEQQFIHSLSYSTLDLLNEFFGHVKLKQATTFDLKPDEVRGVKNAKIMASELRRTFYEITGYDRRQLSCVEISLPQSPVTNKDPALYQQFVQDILFIADETPYSDWSKLSDRQVVDIYNLLKPLCLHGHGSHNDLLICSKACLQLEERPPVDELDKMVSKWVKKFPDSVWAHLFNYMIHFPIPNGSLAPYNESTKASIKKCDNIVRKQAGLTFRKSGAEYFLGKGRGLNAIVSGQEFSWFDRTKTKTHFWRSKETKEKLERVKGQKDVTLKGVIMYQGIQLHFDNTLYPNESKDDLWFYIGFSVAGPYAYDPIDNDTYAAISRQTEENVPRALVISLSGASNSDTKFGTSPAPRLQGEPKMSANSPKLGQRAKRLAPSGFTQTRSSASSSMPSLASSRDGVQETQNLSNLSQSVSRSASSDLPKQPIPSRSLYSSALQKDGTKNQVCKSTARQDTEREPKECIGWKSMTGTRGTEKKVFGPQYVDPEGKLHHGAYVLGLPKSKECTKHTGPVRGVGATKHCNYAHSWKGDTCQHVCTKCTNDNLKYCKEKIDHKDFIWDLGPYCNSSGTIWKVSSSTK